MHLKLSRVCPPCLPKVVDLGAGRTRSRGIKVNHGYDQVNITSRRVNPTIVRGGSRTQVAVKTAYRHSI